MSENKLPFEGSAERNKRKFQCFCCGKQFEDFMGYKLHITEEHEEGREWIKCPRCEAPVRDLKLHWKVKHPQFELPPGNQYRAIVWRDFSSRGEKKKGANKPTFRQGEFMSKKNGKGMHYRSGYECEVYELLEQIPDVVKYDVEPINISYLFEEKPGQWETLIYKPDLSILWLDGRKELWEIKPATQTNLPKNQAKWTTAHKFCEDRGWKFEVMTETGIGQLRAHVARLKRSAPTPDATLPESNENWEVMPPDEFQRRLDSGEVC